MGYLTANSFSCILQIHCPRDSLLDITSLDGDLAWFESVLHYTCLISSS